MTGTPYQLVVLGSDDDWRADVVGAIARALDEEVGRPEALTVEAAVPRAGDPAEAPPQTVVVFLADATSRDDEELVAQLESALDQLLPVLPVVRAGASVFSILPEVVRGLNAVTWERGGTAVVGAILRLLGLIERERRLFLSYRRQESSSLALQLREHLGRRAFDVFLDRFSVPPAEDFQRRIDIELSDKAFVLLLESPAAVDSPWVQHEVTYALTHGISLLALSLPETPDRARFRAVDEAFRLRLSADDLEQADDPVGPDDRVLTQGALDSVLDEIESRYARQLRRRRAALLGSLADWLEEAGMAPRPLSDEWALGAAGPGVDPAVYLVTPRAPTPADLRRLDTLRSENAAGAADAQGHLVFGAPAQDEEDRLLIAWIVDHRPLLTHPHVRVPDFLGI